MTERTLTSEEMLAELHDIRLPETAAGGFPAELLAALGLGILIACALATLLPLLTKGARPPAPASLQSRIADARALPEAERALALLHLVKAHRPEILHKLQTSLYRGNLPDSTALERDLTDA